MKLERAATALPAHGWQLLPLRFHRLDTDSVVLTNLVGEHVFVTPDELDAVWRAISARDDKSHKLWTGDYLAAFAQASDLTLATLDRKLPGRYPSVRVESLLS